MSVEPDQQSKVYLGTHKQIKEIRNKYFHITASRVNEFDGLAIVDEENNATFISELDIEDSFEISISEDAQNIHKLLNTLIENF